MIQKGKLSQPYWKLVDYKTTHRLADPRPCPTEYVEILLKSAY